MHPLHVRENTSNGLESYDIYSRLLKDRIIYLDEDVNDRTASLIVSQMLFLSSAGKEPINFYIDSPGGSVTAGLSIYDTMNSISCPIKTVGLGRCASMGCFLLSAGSKGLRTVLPSTRIMMHQVSSGMKGTIQDMEVSFDNSKYLNDFLYERMALHCGKTAEKLKKDSERDKWMSAEEVVAYGLADEVLLPHEDKWSL